MNRIIYLSTFIPFKKKTNIIKRMRSAANISASAFSYSLLSGLASVFKDQLYVVNTPLTGPYPIYYKDFISKDSISIEFGINVKSIGMCNLYGVQGSSISQKLYRELLEMKAGAADIIVYSAQLPLLKAAVKYKNKFKSSRIILVVPDLFDDINSRSTLKLKIKKLLFGDFDKLCESVDGYVLLTQQMIERMPVRKPFCVVEGIYNPSENREAEKQRSDIFTVFYSGMLYEKFGVKNLIDAVCSLNIKNVRLQLCGSGELEDYIRKKAKNDSRIEYFGMLARDIVLQLQCKASLLVNPRQPNGGFTKYSFPSKNIEYLASGVPTLIYELEGIPKEYYQYCYHLPVEKNRMEDLENAIECIYNIPEKERRIISQKAQNFIIKEKNAPAQCNKILQLINNL